MKFLKNIEVSRQYGVNPTTVANWIESSKQGKNQIQLISVDSKDYVIDNLNNHLIIQELVNKGKKFKSKDSFKVIEPSKEFYNIFQSEQVADIVNSLSLYYEIPNKYNYWDKGAIFWNDFVSRCLKENVHNIVSDTPEMLKRSFELITDQLAEGEKVNIIDIGVGTGHHIKSFIENLQNLGKIRKYIGIDTSQSLITLSRENFQKWFGNALKFEFIQTDFTRYNIQEMLFYNSHPVDAEDEKPVRNIVLLLGGTLQNQREYLDALFNLKNSLSENDILVLGHTLDTPEAKLDFELSTSLDHTEYEKIPDLEKWIPEILGITKEFYDVETYYDSKAKCRFMNLIFNQDIEINFQTSKFKKKVFFPKATKITAWRHIHHSSEEIIEILNKLKLFTKLFIVSNDNIHALTVSIRKYYNY